MQYQDDGAGPGTDRMRVETKPSGQTLSQLVYRSVARMPQGPHALKELLEQARARNALENLTGMLVYDRGLFVQWLEGPRDGLERVWASIQRDARHTEVERLHTPWRAERLFPDWRMQLGVSAGLPAADAQPASRTTIEVPDAAIAELRSLKDHAGEFMDGVAFWQALPTPEAMSAALTAADEGPALALTEQVAALRPGVLAVGLHLLGPVARELGDAWQQDRYSATELLVAQGRLQALMRRVLWDSAAPLPLPEHRVLVALAPGETHIAGLTFAGIALDANGWQVRCAFPRHATELESLLRESHFEMLQVVLSETFTREERMPELAELVRGARRASLNPRLQVLLSGRAIVEQPGLPAVLGADGPGLGQGSDGEDLLGMLAHARRRARFPALMVAQAVLDAVAMKLQRWRQRGARPRRDEDEPGPPPPGQHLS